jgi:hypothetical protein
MPLLGFMYVVCVQISTTNKKNEELSNKQAKQQKTRKNQKKSQSSKLGSSTRTQSSISQVSSCEDQEEIRNLKGSGQPSKLKVITMKNVSNFGKYFVLTPQYDAIREEEQGEYTNSEVSTVNPN